MADGASLADVITAGGAVGAAVLSGVTLWVTGRRSETEWMRSALIDALEHYVQASWVRRRVARRILQARTRGVTPEEWADLMTQRIERHRDQMDRLTRLRLLAADDVVRAAETLLLHDDEFENAAVEDKGVPSREDVARLSQLHDANDVTKAAFILAARRSLGVRGGVGIHERMKMGRLGPPTP